MRGHCRSPKALRGGFVVSLVPLSEVCCVGHLNWTLFSAIQGSLLWLLLRCSVVSSSLWPHGLQHARLLCSSPSSRACSNACLLSQWCHPTVSSSLILCHPLLLLPSIFPANTVFSNELALCIRWPKYWSFSFRISPSNVYSGLISFRMDWFDLLAVQGTLKSILQHHSSKASILRHSLFYSRTLTSIYDYWKNQSFD